MAVQVNVYRQPQFSVVGYASAKVDVFRDSYCIVDKQDEGAHSIGRIALRFFASLAVDIAYLALFGLGLGEALIRGILALPVLVLSVPFKGNEVFDRSVFTPIVKGSYATLVHSGLNIASLIHNHLEDGAIGNDRNYLVNAFVPMPGHDY